MSAFRSLEDYVRQHAQEQPDKVAVIAAGRTLNYAHLWQAICQRRNELIADGMTEGRLHIFRNSQDVSFIIDYLATHLTGAAAVPLDKSLPQTVYDRLVTDYGHLVLPKAVSNAERIDDILFTTGTTGRQKGVMESQRAIMANAENLSEAQGFTTETVFVICGPLSHIGSLSKLWPVLMLGGSLIILDGMKDLEALFTAFDYPSRHIATFMVPSGISLLMRLGLDKISGLATRIEFLETGGAAITQTDMQALCRLLPHTRLYNTYASTETGIVCTHDYQAGPCQAGCVGHPMRHSQVSIMPDGTIACTGQTLMSGYLGDKELTRSVLHDGAVHTSDLGFLDAERRLHIRGRNDDVINLGGYKVSPIEVENAASAHPAVAACICCHVSDTIFGDTLQLVYTVRKGHEVSQRDLAHFLAQRLETYKVPRHYEQVDALQLTFNGKPNRRYYNQRVATQSVKRE